MIKQKLVIPTQSGPQSIEGQFDISKDDLRQYALENNVLEVNVKEGMFVNSESYSLRTGMQACDQMVKILVDFCLGPTELEIIIDLSSDFGRVPRWFAFFIPKFGSVEYQDRDNYGIAVMHLTYLFRKIGDIDIEINRYIVEKWDTDHDTVAGKLQDLIPNHGDYNLKENSCSICTRMLNHPCSLCFTCFLIY